LVPDRAQRHRGRSVARQPSHLAGEVCVRDVELGKRSAGRRVSQHVVHEDRDRRRSGETRGCRLPSGCGLWCGRSRVACLAPRRRSRNCGAGRVRRKREARCERRDGRDRPSSKTLCTVGIPCAGHDTHGRRRPKPAPNRALTGRQQRLLEPVLSSVVSDQPAERLPEEGNLWSTASGADNRTEVP
jgi:hypothetical protein